MPKKLLAYLCCPQCKRDFVVKGRKLICRGCMSVFSVEDGIPMLIDLAHVPPYITHQVHYFEEENKLRPTYRLDPWQKSYLERFFAHNKVTKRSVVLDIGCGSGYMAVEIAKKGATVIACDLTLAQLKNLRKTIKSFGLENNLYLVCCSAESLPFKDNIADIVIENAILEHLSNEEIAIREITRISKEWSGLMIAVPHAYRYLWPFLIPVNIWYDKRIGHVRRYTKKSLVEKFPHFSLEAFYYTGNILKFILFAVSVLFKTDKFNMLAEQLDQKWKNIRYGATVITVFLRKR